MEDLSPSTLKQFLTGIAPTPNSSNCNGYIRDTDKITAELSIDIIKYVCDFKLKNTSYHKYALTMRRCVKDMLVKHEYLFNGMVDKLKISLDNLKLTFDSVMCELLTDGQMNWGRVVSVYAFSARIAKHLMDENFSKDKVLQRVSEVCSLFVSTNLGNWMQKQGGWSSFEEHFPEPDRVEKTFFQGLIVTAAALGIGAIASMVAAK